LNFFSQSQVRLKTLDLLIFQSSLCLIRRISIGRSFETAGCLSGFRWDVCIGWSAADCSSISYATLKAVPIHEVKSVLRFSSKIIFRPHLHVVINVLFKCAYGASA
jgi:hypothetical protein